MPNHSEAVTGYDPTATENAENANTQKKAVANRHRPIFLFSTSRLGFFNYSCFAVVVYLPKLLAIFLFAEFIFPLATVRTI